MFSTTLKRAVAISSIALLAACGSDDESVASNTEYTAITEDTIPTGFSYTSGVNATYYADEVYGPDERNTFEIFLPESEEPTSLIIFVHGGGFFTGDKSSAYYSFAEDGTPSISVDGVSDINEVLEAGVAYATINYSLLNVPNFTPGYEGSENDTEGLTKSLSDIREALQYIRHNAEELNINPDEIAMYGVSAGAVSSLWLAYSDDMASTTADEALNASESTRIVAAGAIETQASLDLVRWESILTVPDVFSFSLEDAVELGAASFMESVYGIASGSNSLDMIRAETGELSEYRSSLDLPALIDANDPPVFVSNEAVIVNDTLAAFTEIEVVAASGIQAYAEFEAAAEIGDLDTAGIKLTEAAAAQAAAEALAGQLINAVLHFPTHALTIMQTAMDEGAEVVANIPELLDDSTASAVNPADLTVIPFLLAELEAQ